jgi:hypothetical protein
MINCEHEWTEWEKGGEYDSERYPPITVTVEQRKCKKCGQIEERELS